MAAANDLCGLRYGRLTVRSHVSTPRGRRWVCRCDCGATKEIRGDALTRGITVSCGCFHAEVSADVCRRAVNFKHGQAYTKENGIWRRMKQRCENPRNPKFKDYGARGISVCSSWKHDFSAFLADMGPRPSPDLSLDRIDNNKGYEPGNCRWATAVEQRNNQRRCVGAKNG